MSDAAFSCAHFARSLRSAGVPVAPGQVAAFAAAIARRDPLEPEDLYWIARTALVSSAAELGTFHTVFQAEFAPLRNLERERDALGRERHDVPVQVPSRDTPPGDERAADSEAADAPFALAMASDEERLRERDFAIMSERELLAARRAIERLRVASPVRRAAARKRAHRGDRLDIAHMLRSAARTGGELARLRHTRRRERLRPLIFLCDVSGSMEPYAEMMLRYAYAAAQGRPGVHAFAFATQLTDLGPYLRDPDRNRAFAALARDLPDRGGGTRIGTTLAELNARYVQRGLTRGGVVTILSDGWERGEPNLLASQMRRLRLMSRRIVWVNPQKRHPAYEPLVRGMAAALPYVDAFVSGHNVRSFEALAAAIEEGLA